MSEDHRHKWAIVEASLIRELARYLAGEIARPRREQVARSCSVCGGFPCTGRAPVRDGSPYGCALAYGHEGACHNPHIPARQRFEPPPPPPGWSPPSPPPTASAPAPVPAPVAPPADESGVALELPA